MRTHIRSTLLSVSAVVVCLAGLAVPMLPAASAPAADDCVASPNAAPPAGQHWWYRTDRATRKKCWYLGPQDKDAAARKAERQERVQERAAPASSERADEQEKEPASPQTAASPAAAAQSESPSPHAFALGTAESVPHLVNWAEMLEEAGIMNAGETTAPRWTDDTAARAAWAKEDQAAAGAGETASGKDESRAPQAAAAPADVNGGVSNNANKAPHTSGAATLAGIPVGFIAILLIACGVGPAIYSAVRALRRRRARRQLQTRAIGAFEGALPPFLQQQDAALVPSGQGYARGYAEDDDAQGHGHARAQEHARGYGGEDELRRILDGLHRRAA